MSVAPVRRSRGATTLGCAALLGLLTATGPTFAAELRDPAALEAAVAAEIERTLGMKLPDQPPPYYVGFEVLDGAVATASAAFGALTSSDDGPYRSLRSEVRVGDYTLDNANFDVGMGERDGVQSRGLPLDDLEVALRRELWLSADLGYKGAAEQYSARLAARKGRDQGKHAASFTKVPPLVLARGEPRPVDGARVVSAVESLSGLLSAYPELEDGSAVARDWQGFRYIASSEGTRAWLPTGFTVLLVEAIARAPDGARLRNCRWWVSRDAAGLPAQAELQAEVAEMARWLLDSRGAPVEDDYLGPVLFEEPAAIELFRQLLLSELSGTPPAESAPDPYNEGASDGPPAARLGRRLLPDGWSAVDDPAAYPGEAGAYTHDFEGVAAERVELVRDGVVRDLLMSRVPRLDRAGSNGHGRSLGTDRRVGLPGVLKVEPERERSQRRLRKKALALAREAGLPYVIVVRRLEPLALAEDFHIAFTGEGPLPGLTRPLEAYRLYPDGREEPVRGLEFVGVDVRALRDIALAGPTSAPLGVMDGAPGAGRFGIGAVGGLPTTWMAPPVVIRELELRGQGGREPRVLTPPP